MIEQRFPAGGSRPTRRPQPALCGVASYFRFFLAVDNQDNQLILSPGWKMDKFVIHSPQKIKKPDLPSAANSNDPSILDPGEQAPNMSGRSASNTGNTKYRKYQDSWLIDELWCYSIVKNPWPRQCVICTKVLANKCMRLSKWIRHLQAIHPQYRIKPRAFFKCKAKELTHAQNVMRDITAIDKKLLRTQLRKKSPKQRKGIQMQKLWFSHLRGCSDWHLNTLLSA